MEYEALLVGLRVAKYVGATKVVAYSDSQLVALPMEQVDEIKNDRLRKYTEACERARNDFQEVILKKVLQEENRRVDELAWMTNTLTH